MTMPSPGVRIAFVAALLLRSAACLAGDFRPLQEPLPIAPPEGAIVLFGDGSEGAPKFVSMSGGPIDWKVEDGALVARASPGHANHILSAIPFRDAEGIEDLHLVMAVDVQAAVPLGDRRRHELGVDVGILEDRGREDVVGMLP